MSHCEPKAPFCNIWHIWAKYLFWCDHSPSNWSNTAIFSLSQWPLAMRKHHVDTSFEKWQWPDMTWHFPTSSNVTSHIFHAIWANPSMNQWSTSSNQMSLSMSSQPPQRKPTPSIITWSHISIRHCWPCKAPKLTHKGQTSMQMGSMSIEEFTPIWKIKSWHSIMRARAKAFLWMPHVALD